MPKHAIWRDVSKTSATGLRYPEYRLKMPNGEAVLKLAKGAVFDAKDPSQQIYTVRCFSVGIHEASTGERDIEKAKKAAIDMVRKRMLETITAYQEDLTALENVITREVKAEPANLTQTNTSTPKTKTDDMAAPKRRGRPAKTDVPTDTKTTPQKSAKKDTNVPAAPRKRRGRPVSK